MFSKQTLRPYQERAVDSIKSANAIVKMPTGSGKTFIAAELVRQSLLSNVISDPSSTPALLQTQRISSKALFLVPNCDLVDQQANAIKDWCGVNVDVQKYMGGESASTSF